MFSRLQMRHLYPVIPLVWLVLIPVGPLVDNSFLWHVRAGAIQLGSQRVITTDPFSFAAAGEPWRTQSWLAELMYAYLESALGGISWARILVALVMVTALALTGLTIYANARSLVTTTVWLIIAVWLLAAFSQPRPVMFSFLLLASLVLIVTAGRRLWWAIVPIIWIWAGFHGTWIIGVGLVVLDAIRRRSPRLGMVAAASVVATGFTAHGLGTWNVLLSFLENSGALKYLQEWQPPDFGDLIQMPYVLIIAGLLVAAVGGKIRAQSLWIILPFLAFGLTSRRTVPIAALVLVPFAARAVIYRLPEPRRQRTVIPVIALGIGAVMVVGTYALTDVELGSERFPSDEAIEAAGGGRVFHDFGVGGYLIYRYGPERQVYIDDRAELYGETRFAEFESARLGDYRSLFDRLDLRAAIVKEKWPLYRVLLQDGWRVKYSDESFAVLRQVEP